MENDIGCLDRMVTKYDIYNIINLLSSGLQMSFFNLFSSGASSLFNFNLQGLTNSLGFSSSLEVSTPKILNTEQIIKEPSPQPKESVEEIQQSQAPSGCNDSRVQLFTQQQQLINQYMHLNIQLLSKKLQNLEQIEKLPKTEELQNQHQIKSSKKKIKKANNCGHPEKEHYAKGMCSNCYHKYGRTKKPWNCPHDKLYANGMCQNCYINSYNKKRREEKVDEKNQEMESPSELKEEQHS